MKLLQKIRALFQRGKLDAEMAEEMRAHLEMQAQANRAGGMSPEEARYAASRQFGGLDQIKEVARAQRGLLWLEQFFQDLRYGVRALRKAPGFTTVAVLSLALGIGANTAIFSLVNDVLLKMLPVKNPQELVLLHWSAAQGWPGPVSGSWETDPVTKVQTCTSFSLGTFELFQEKNETLSSLFAFAPLSSPTLIIDGQAEVSRYGGQFVSGGYFGGLGVSASVGRMIEPEDDRPGATPVAVISHRYWQQRLGGDPVAVGKIILVNNVPVTIVGVTPRGFLGTLDVGSAPDISLPIALLPLVDAETAGLLKPSGGMWWLRIMGRLKPGITREQANANLAGVFRQFAVEELKVLPAHRRPEANSSSEIPALGVGFGGQGLNNLRHGYTRMLMVLTSLVALVLVIACANVASLLLARGVARRREIAARLALGAGRGRLVRQLLTESALLVLLGGGAGILLAEGGKRVLLAMNPLQSAGERPLVLSAALDWRVLGFTAVLATICVLLVGLVPAWRATRVELNAEFQGGARNLGNARSRTGKSLVVVQVALSLVLLVGAGLFVRTLRNLEEVEVGFNRERLLLFSIDARPPVYEATRSAALHERVVASLRTIPGVSLATFSRMPLLSNAGWNSRVVIPGRPAPVSGRPNTAMLNAVGPDFFSTLEIPRLLGRSFSSADEAGALRVALINETMAKQYFPDENAVGRRFSRIGPSGPVELEIVGVVRDAKYADVKNRTPATFYVPFPQEAASEANYAVRTRGEPATVVAAIRAAVRAIDPNLPLATVRTQEEQIAQLFSQERLAARFSSFFGLLALTLSCVGLYGLMSFNVLRRTGEIGIRVALGALPRGVLWMVLREALGLVLLGALVGLGAALTLTRLVEKMLYGVSPIDPLTFGVVASVLLLAALVASWLPARRAAKIDPIVALRCD